jgi:hypothetical protein
LSKLDKYLSTKAVGNLERLHRMRATIVLIKLQGAINKYENENTVIKIFEEKKQ